MTHRIAISQAEYPDGDVEKILGFAAFTKIPHTLARLASGFNIEYLVYDPYLDEDIVNNNIAKVTFEALLSESDIISIHAALVEEIRPTRSGRSRSGDLDQHRSRTTAYRRTRHLRGVVGQ